jgi:ClpP class serine protease
MGMVSGSGGYWIAAPCTKIVANNNTITVCVNDIE